MADIDKELDEFINRDDVYEETGEAYPAWNSSDNKDFKKGSHILGVLIEKRQNVGQNNQNLYVVEKRGGDKMSIWGSTVMDARLANKELGQELAIIYKGKTKSEKTGRSYHDFEFYFANYKNQGDIPDDIFDDVKE